MGWTTPILVHCYNGPNDAGINESVLTDYFLSTPETIDVLPDRIGKSVNLVKSAYADHAVDLPELLQGLAPAARPFPFERIGPNAPRVRRPDKSPLSSPFPSWQEFLESAVPSLAADEEVIRRLNNHGWAFVLDVASIGKSTLAYRIAARPEYRNKPAYQVLLSQLTVDEAESEISPQAALARLARPGVLFVIDNAHLQPEVAHTLWQQWRDRPMGSKLIILATRMERVINLPGQTSLRDLEENSANPAVLLSPAPEDLAPILNYVLARIDNSAHAKLAATFDDLKAWHKLYGREIGAFVVAVSQRHREILDGDFSLPEATCAEWIKERHLNNLGAKGVENAVSLAVFCEQYLELSVPDYALPYPVQIAQLLKSGLAKRMAVSGEEFVCYGLREPGWGQLILAAIETPPNRSLILAKTASKSIALSAWVWKRIRHSRPRAEWAVFWDQLTDRAEYLVTDVTKSSLSICSSFLNSALQQGQSVLVEKLWGALAAQPIKLIDRAIAAPLSGLAAFLNIAEQHNQKILLDILWSALAAQTSQLAVRGIAEPWGILAHSSERPERRTRV